MVLLSLCRETETLCQEIYERPYNSFISDATANGLILMKLPETWSTNEKMFASGGQGHGFAAEQGNHIVDRVRLKNARILGDNNARNGADRLVSGTEIQTKYCSTAPVASVRHSTDKTDSIVTWEIMAPCNWKSP